MHTNQTKKLITIKKAAAIIGVDYRNLLAGVAAGRVPSYQISRSRKLVSVAEVLSCMKNQKEIK